MHTFFFFFFFLVLISVKTGALSMALGQCLVVLQVKIALHDILLVVPIVCACPTAWGIGDLHQTAAVEEEPCPSAVCSMSPGAVELAEKEAFDRFRRLKQAILDITVQCGWARLILDRFHDLVLSSGNPMTATHEPDSVSHEHKLFLFGLWEWYC